MAGPRRGRTHESPATCGQGTPARYARERRTKPWVAGLSDRTSRIVAREICRGGGKAQKHEADSLSSIGWRRGGAGPFLSKATLLPSICRPNPDLGLLQTHTPAPFPEFPGQIRGMLSRQFIQPRNLQCLERQSISNPHSLPLTQG